MKRCGAVFVLAALAFSAAPASAALRLCNQTSYVLYAASAWQDRPNIVTQGWTRVAPGSCAQAIASVLTAPAYYVYARTSQAHAGPSRNWGGNAQFCVKDGNFSLRAPMAASGCQSDDAFPVPFAQINTQAMKNWTMTFTESAQGGRMDAARNAGIDRLLSDIGFKVGRNGAMDRDAALKKFRARMKLPANANDSDLFDALETEALKVAAPAGYSICNESNAELWAALGLKSGKTWVSQGWWHVAPGACAKALTDPLSADKIYLHAEKHGNHQLVAGPAHFCITNITFEVQGKENCAKRGLANAGFAATNTKGVTGFAAHISDNGLVPTVAVR
ncbi:MAG TPA: DUF1036 domain-containing protein [Rhizomicrobium sp.]|nr:DUF1036 domain-containing protein [Rhizomicrobium sp.]